MEILSFRRPLKFQGSLVLISISVFPLLILTNAQAQENVVVNRCVSSSLADVPETILIHKYLRVKKDTTDGQIYRFTARSGELNCGKISSLSIPVDTYASDKASFLVSGELKIGNEYFPTNEFCISRIDKKIVELSYCQVNCGNSHICIPKCCPLDEVIQLSKSNARFRCVSSGSGRWAPWIYRADEVETPSAEWISSHLPIHYKHQPSPHPEIDIIRTYENLTYSFLHAEFRMLDNSSLAINEIDEWIFANHLQDFCIDGVVLKQKGIKNEVYLREEGRQIAFWFGEEESKFETILKLCAFMAAILFLILTVIIYLVIWEKHNIHGWTVFSFACSMLVFLIALAIAQFITLFHDESILETGNCVALGIVIHFAFLCILCWMMMINFDFWATFRNLSPSRGGHKNLQRYLLYCLFSFGVPFLITMVSVIVYYSTNTESDYSPRYGLEYCRLHSSSDFYYLYIPMTISLVFNLVMFSWTVLTLWRYKKKTQSAGSNSNSHNQWILFCKLFLIMGITWFMELISGFVEPSNAYLVTVFLVFDFINTTFQAAAVFFIFAAKRENLLWIFKRYPKTRGILGPILRFRLCRVDDSDVEQTEMTSADKNKIDRNTMVTFNKARASTASNNSY